MGFIRVYPHKDYRKMLSRQKTLVTMLRYAGGSASRVQLTKWAFLLATETPSHGNSGYYQFVPYLYGPHSFSLYREMNLLVRDGIVEPPEGNSGWKLTDTGLRTPLVVEPSVRTGVRYVMSRYGSMSGRQLMEMVYEQHPWFTINSEDGDQHHERRPIAEAAIYTLGYEGLSVDGFLNQLLYDGMKCVLDVRSNPVSRRFGFHKSTLAHLCNLIGIEYRHFPELGIPASDRSNLVTKDDYAKLFANYRSTVLPVQDGVLRQVASIAMSCPTVLLCMEANPAYCHRSSLAQAVAPLANLPVVHLEWPR